MFVAFLGFMNFKMMLYIDCIIQYLFFFFQSQLNRSNNEIKLSWDSSCSVIDQPIGYVITYKDLTTDQGSRIMKSKTVDTKLSHTFKDTSVKYGTEYRFTVNTGNVSQMLISYSYYIVTVFFSIEVLFKETVIVEKCSPNPFSQNITTVQLISKCRFCV